MGEYRKLQVWQEARDLAIDIYSLTDGSPFRNDLSLKDQIRRAAISIPSNIAEGEESGFKKSSIRYLYYAKASLAELDTQIEIAYQTNFIDKIWCESLMERIDRLSRKLNKLIQYRSQ